MFDIILNVYINISVYNMYIELAFLWLPCWREAEEWLGVKATNMQESRRVKIQKNKQVPRKTVAYHKGMIHNTQGKALSRASSCRNQRTELNDERHSTQQ